MTILYNLLVLWKSSCVIVYTTLRVLVSSTSDVVQGGVASSTPERKAQQLNTKYCNMWFVV